MNETTRTLGVLLVLVLAGVLLAVASERPSFGYGAGVLLASAGVVGLLVALIRKPQQD